MSRFSRRLALVFLPLTALAAGPAVQPEPVRIAIECEDMQGVAQDRFGPGPGWQVGRWGQDLYQNMTFGGAWASRLRVAMTDAGDNPAEISAQFEAPARGVYKVWVKYECPPFFNYAFGVRIEQAGATNGPVFKKTYGLRQSAKHFCFKNEPLAGDLYWRWGIDHDAAEGYVARLAKGRYRLTLSKMKNPAPGGARSIDAVLITSDLSPISTPRYSRYPLLDELRRANHVYFRFRNPGSASEPVFITWDHGNHSRRPSIYRVMPQDRELVKFYDEQGWQLAGGEKGNWPEGIAPGAAGPWYDLGPTMNTESESPFTMAARPQGATKTDPSAPFSVDIALKPNEKGIVKSFTLDPGEPILSFVVQPDLNRAEGVAATRKVLGIFRELTAALDAQPRLGPLPKKLGLFGGTGVPYPQFAEGLDERMALREAVGLNTISGNADTNLMAAMLAWGRAHGGILERSLGRHHTQDMQKIIDEVRQRGIHKQFSYVSFGDEIGLPDIDPNDSRKVVAFHEFLRRRGETPQSLGLSGWDQVKPLATLAGSGADQVGSQAEEKRESESDLDKVKRLYWHSLAFRGEQGIAGFAEKTRMLRDALGNEVHTTANLGISTVYWMNQTSFIEAFKQGAMSLAWSEDYTYCQPEASRLVAEFETAYLRKGASYHDTPIQFFCMPHWPGNNAEQLIQNAVLEWGQNVKDLNFYCPSPGTEGGENYVAWRGGLPTFKALRTLSGMAGLIEDHLLPARTEPARIAMLLSEASDVWETEGRGQGAIAPGTVASNVSQEERKAIWYALRYSGYRVDFLTENDCKDGLLKPYAVAYLCGQNLERQAAAAVRDWVSAGGAVFATAGAARKDEFDAPLTDLDDVFGRGLAQSSERFKGPLRARLELLFVKALDRVKLASGKAIPVYCSREEFAAVSNAHVLATYKNGKPALIENGFGKGRAYYAGMLPGQAWVRAALPVLPQGKGGPHTAPHMTEWLDRDPEAAGVILAPLRGGGIEPDVAVNHRGVVVNRLKSDASTVVTVVNLALEADGELKDVELRVSGTRPVKRAWSCFHPKESLLKGVENGVSVIRLPSLGPADVIVLEH